MIRGIWAGRSDARRRCCAFLCVLSMLFQNPGASFAESRDHTGEAVCGLQEHVHTEQCYEEDLICGQEEREEETETVRIFQGGFEVHQHRDSCYNADGELQCGYVADEYYHTHSEYCRDENGELVCGLETRKPHTHDDSCYVAEKTLVCDNTDPGHIHTDACIRRTEELTCTLEETDGHVHTGACYTENKKLVCETEKGAGAHTHTDACYTENKELICGEEEAEGAHSHSDACYTENTKLICGEEEGAGAHSHSDSCYTENTKLICGTEEGTGAHSHSDSCYTENTELICGTEEGAGAHAHEDACYEERKELVCSEDHEHMDSCYETRWVLACRKEESAGHQHTGSCYETIRTLGCGKEESVGHQHTESCYETTRTLGCGKEESAGHQHTGSCYETTRTLSCGKEESAGHQHTDACYETERVLTCGKPEETAHHHGDECFKTITEYICGEEERLAHVHDDSCYQETRRLACGRIETKHRHTEKCFDEKGHAICGELEIQTFTCTAENWTEEKKQASEGHHHSRDCYEQRLVCELPEHQHTAECLKAEDEPEEQSGETPDGTLDGTKKETFEDNQEDNSGDTSEEAEVWNTETDKDSDPDKDTDPEAGLETSTETEAEIEADPEPATETETEPETESGNETDTDPEAKPEGEDDPAPETEESMLAEITLQSDEDAPYQVTVTFGSDAGLPEGTRLVVTEEQAPVSGLPGSGAASQIKSSAKLNTGLSLKTAGAASASRTVAPVNLDADYPQAGVGLNVWQSGEEIPEIVLYRKTLDLSLMAEGEEIEPNPEARVTVSVVLPDLEEGLEVQVRHETENGSVLLESSMEGRKVTFTTDSFSLFDFYAAATELSSWHTGLMEGTFFGRNSGVETGYSQLDTPLQNVAEGLTVLNAFRVSRSGDLWLTLQQIQDALLGQRENLSLYTVTDGRLDALVKENITMAEILRMSLETVSGLALVRDSGLRRKLAEFGDISLQGMMPKDASATANDVAEAYQEYRPEDADESFRTIAAYDISISSGGVEYQPEDGPIRVSIRNEAILEAAESGKALSLWHVTDDGTAEPVTEFTVAEDTITFEASGFSTYVVGEYTIEKIIEAGDGHTYRITVEYDGSAGIPGDAELKVEEVPETQSAAYLTEAAAVLESEISEFSYGRLFNISIVKDGVEYQPNSMVKVSVELMDTERISDVQVVHFENETAGEKLAASTDSRTVIFETDGFSVFSLMDKITLRTFTALDHLSTAILGERTGTLYENDDIILTGSLPALGIIEAERVDLTVSGVEPLVAYDIRIYGGPLSRAMGYTWQPAGESVQVTLKSDALAAETADVYHLTDYDSEPELVAEDLAIAENTVAFDADSFSVYAIFDHEDGQLITPRIMFHYIGYDHTITYPEGVMTYSAEPYNFLDQSDEYLATQIVKSGESLADVPTPPVYNQQYFNGWYVVDMTQDHSFFNTTSRRFTGQISYIIPNDPTRQNFNETINIARGAEDATGIPLTWTMNGKEYTLYADDEGCAHIYLAPLYANFNYVNFYDYNNNFIARKLLVLDSNGFSSMVVSDLEATSPININNTFHYFMGWSSEPYQSGNNPQTAENTIPLYRDGYKETVYITLYGGTDYSDTHTLDIYYGGESYTSTSELTSGTLRLEDYDTAATQGDVNLYAEYENAHWLRFIAGESGWGAMYVPADYLVGEAAATKLPTTTRTGYQFDGWYSGYQDSNGTIWYYQKVTDGEGNVLTNDGDFKLINAAEPDGNDGNNIQVTNYQGGTTSIDYTQTGTVSGTGLQMTEDSYLFAKWVSNATAQYKVIIWQQKVTDDVNTTKTSDDLAEWLAEDTSRREEDYPYPIKQYDFVNAYIETENATSLVTLPGNSEYLTRNYTGFHLGRYDKNVWIDPQNTSVINVYYDRDLITFTFDFSQNNSIDVYMPTTDNDGTQYALIDGEYVRLTYDSTAQKWYVNYLQEINGSFGRLENGEFVKLKPVTTPTEVFVLTSSLTAGNEYLIVSTNNTGNGYVLGRNGTNVAAYPVAINSGSPVYVYASDVNTTSVWTVSGSYKFMNSGYYLRYPNNNLGIATTNSYNSWNLRTGNNHGLYEGIYDLYFSGTSFSLNRNNYSNVYLYQKTTRDIITGYTYGDGILYNGNLYSPTTNTSQYSVEWTGPRYKKATSPAVMTGLYMQPLSQYGYTWLSDYVWYLSRDGSSVTLQPARYEFSETFTAYFYQTYNNPYTMQFFKQKVDGSEPDYNGTPDASRYYNSNTTTSPSVFWYQFAGFTPAKYRKLSAGNWIEITEDNRSSRFTVDDTVQLYFTRNSYTLTFATNYPGDAQFTGAERSSNREISALYQQTLTNAQGAAPTFTAPDHYIFDGWYEDASGTVPFNWNQTMPAANKVVYAKWYPVYYLIQIDPNGGVLAGNDNQNESTYFWLQYGQTIGQYNTKREYVEATAQEVAELGDSGTYYYRYVKPTVNTNGTVLEHGRWNPYPNVQLWESDLESDKDAEGIRPAYYRMAEYIKVSDYHTANDAFYQHLISSGLTQEQAAAWDHRYVDTGKKFRKAEETDPSWVFVGWYRDGTPYNFANSVTQDITIRAAWRQAGNYYLYYNPRMESGGISGTLSGNAYDPGNPSTTVNGYIDKATTHAATAPEHITGPSGDNNSYVFEGWRVVGLNGNPLDENGNVMTEEVFAANASQYLFQPGDEITVRSEQAHLSNDGHLMIELRAYYKKIENSARYPATVQLILDANKDYTGYIDPDAATWPIWANPGNSAVNTGSELDSYSRPTRIAFGDAEINQGIHLVNYRDFFLQENGDFLLGFDPQPDPEQCDNGPYIPKYAADAVIGIDDPDATNILYAIWEPMVYVTFVNHTGAPVRVSLDSLQGVDTIEATIINNATQAYDRSAITAMEAVTISSGQTVRLVFPKGMMPVTGGNPEAGRELTLSIQNNHVGFKMSATKQVGDAQAVQLFGGNSSNPALENGQAKQDVQALIRSYTGIIYTLTEEALPLAYFDPNGGTWTDNAHTASSEAQWNIALKPDGRVFLGATEQNADRVQYKIKIEQFMKPASDPTKSGDYQFLGWTTDENVARFVRENGDFSLTIEQLTERRNNASPGSDDYSMYDALMTLIAEYKAAYHITEVTNLLQVVENYSLWNFNNEPAGTTYYAVYAQTARVNYHIMIADNTNNHNHVWNLSGNTTSTGQAGTVYTRTTVYESGDNNRSHYVWYRTVVRGRSIIKPPAPSYYNNNNNYTFLYWLEDNRHTIGNTNPSDVIAFSFVEPITRDLDLYTSWTEMKYTTLRVIKKVDGAQSSTEDTFNLRYDVTTYKYTYTGGMSRSEYGVPDSTGIVLQGTTNVPGTEILNYRDIKLYYWTDNEGNFYCQALNLREETLAGNGYELVITDNEGRTSTGSVDASSSLVYVNNENGQNYYKYYPVANHHVESNQDYYISYAGEKEQKPVWRYQKGSYDLYFWNNTWYDDYQCNTVSVNQRPNANQQVIFTNTKNAKIRFVKTDRNGYDRLNGARFTISKIDGNGTAASQVLNFETGYVRTASETAGRNGRFILTVGQTIPAESPIQMDTDHNELVFTEKGKYRLTETAAPSGYSLPSQLATGDPLHGVDYIDITVSETGITVGEGNTAIATTEPLSQLNIGEFDHENEYAVVIKNAPKTAYFRLQKVDTSGNPILNGISDTNGDPTSGLATFTVSGTASASGVWVSLGSISTVISGEGAAAYTEVQAVPYGTYTVTETLAPVGYRTADATRLVFSDGSNGQAVLVASGGNVFGTVTGTGTQADPFIVKIQDEEIGYNLMLTKTVVNVPEDGVVRDYSVTVTAQGDTVTKVAGKTYNVVRVDANNASTNTSVQFDGTGAAAVTIRENETVALRSLPRGSYIISEATAAIDAGTNAPDPVPFATAIVVTEPATSHTLVSSTTNSTNPFTLSNNARATITNTFGHTVRISKTVTGGMANQTDTFPLTITGSAVTHYIYTGSRSDDGGANFTVMDFAATPASGTNPGHIEFTTSNNKPVNGGPITGNTIIVINGVLDGNYTLTETLPADSGYILTATVGGVSATVQNGALSVTVNNADLLVEMINTWEAVAPTDYSSNSGPFAAILGLGAVMLVTVVTGSRRRRKEE